MLGLYEFKCNVLHTFALLTTVFFVLVPEGLQKPLVDGVNSSVMSISWEEPAFPNGPKPMYTVQKTIPALSYPPQVIRGTRFPGGGYYLFPPDTVPANVEFTGMLNSVRNMF